MKRSADLKLITVLFGSLGDGLMALAFFDDVLRLAPNATLTILTRRSVGLLHTLAKEYPQITVLEIPRGARAVPFFARLVFKRWTLVTLGLVSIGYSLPLKLFFLTLRLTGSRTIGFHDRTLAVHLNFDISKLMIGNLRRLIPYVLPGHSAPTGAPRVHLPQTKPAHMPPEPYMVAHVCGVSIANALPPRRWQALLEHIHRHRPTLRVALTGTPHERQKLKILAQGRPSVEVRTDLSIPELVYLVAHAALYVGIDTGVTHIAGVLQKKSVIIRHCGDPTWMPSYNPNARVLFDATHCSPEDPLYCVMVEEDGVAYRRCAYDIAEQDLFGAIDQALV